MAPYLSTRLAVRRRQETDQVLEGVGQSVFPAALVQLVQVVCSICGMLGHAADKCQSEPFEEDPSEHFEPMEEDDPEDEPSVELDVSSDEDTMPAIPAWCPYCGMSNYHDEKCIYAVEEESEMPEFIQLSEEDPSEQYNLPERSESESEEIEQPVLPVMPALPEGPAPPRCPSCRMPGHEPEECYLFSCLQCDGPRSISHPVCSTCDPPQTFTFDRVCGWCRSEWATMGLFCAGCDLVDYTPSTPSTEISSFEGSSASPTYQPGSHAEFDLNLLPPEEEMEVIVVNDDEDDDDISVMIVED